MTMLHEEPITARNPLFISGGIYEVVIPQDPTINGYFDNEASLNEAVAPYDGAVKAIYVRLNPVMPELLAHAPNCLNDKKKYSTHDSDIGRRVRFFFDFDPERKPGVSSTNAEHHAAIDLAIKVMDFLRDLGWPEPILADSGNGAHLVYWIDLPNDEHAKEVIRGILKFIAEKFKNDLVKVDTSVSNASRLIKLYGTMTCKGPDTDERPHRRSMILSRPLLEEMQAVPAELLELLASMPLPSSEEKKSKKTRGRPRKDDWSRRKPYSLKEVARMLACIPADDRDLWRYVGIILGREFKRSEAAWALYVEWAAKWTGVKGREHDKTMREAFYEISQQPAERELSLATIVRAALENGWAPRSGDVLIEDLLYVVQANKFLDRSSTGAYWIREAVDAVVSPVNVDEKMVKASDWLKAHAMVTSLACDPTLDEEYFVGADYIDGELVPRQGRACFNIYKRSTIELGDATKAEPFVEHCGLLFNKPGDADQFLNYMAHLVQRPGVKPRFALLISGPMGNGKDTALSLCYPVIGHQNVQSIDPKDLESGFNEYEAKTLVVISETANTQEMSKWAFNERTKVLIAGNPDRTMINPKYGVKFSIKRFCGVVITTNHLASGIYIPQGDRRYDVLDTATFTEMKLTDEGKRRAYFETLYDWFNGGGDRHVAALLHARDLTRFSPDHGQRKTAAHQTVVAANLEADDWVTDILHSYADPDWVRADCIVQKAVEGGEKEMDIRRKLGSAMERSGYVKHRNPERADGRWSWVGVLVTYYRKVDVLPPPTKEEFLALLEDMVPNKRPL